MDVGGWLRGLGLGQYEEKFRDNKIDADLLPRLTVDDLKDIGVSVVGDRRRLLDAIAAIAGAGPPADLAPDEVCSIQGPSGIGRTPPDHGDVLRSRRVDEPRREARRGGLAQPRQHLSRRGFGGGDRAWRPCVEKARRRVDGAVRLSSGAGERRRARGARRARDPARACRNQRQERQQRRAGAFRADRPRFRAGRGRRNGGEVFGDAPNVAARVQAAAEPGSVLITATCSARSPDSSSSRSKARAELKGVVRPSALYRIVRASGGGRRGGARALTPFVGREEELDLLAPALGARPGRRRPTRADCRRAWSGQVAADGGVPRAASARRRTPGSNGRRRSCCRTRRSIQSPNGAGSDSARMLPAEQRLADLEGTSAV